MDHLPAAISAALPSPPRHETPGAGRASNVIAFVPRPRRAGGLSARDRIDIAGWAALAAEHGYDRLVVHERDPSDPPDIDNFLSIYRRGDRWATWSIARSGAVLQAWNSTTGTDVGQFPTIPDALAAVLGAT